jgi:hypothetical protein
MFLDGSNDTDWVLYIMIFYINLVKYRKKSTLIHNLYALVAECFCTAMQQAKDMHGT